MIAIVDYEAGNLTSVLRAIDKLGLKAVITADPDEILKADRVIFPGVGAAGSAMSSLKKLGLDKALHEVRANERPMLGICLGTQIIFEFSEEDGGTPCLGLLKGDTKRFPSELMSEGRRLKVPHMGWNSLRIVRPHPVLEGIKPEHEFYFVHSFYPSPADYADRHRVDQLWSVFRLGGGFKKPGGHPVPPGKKRPAGPEDSGKLLFMGRTLCSVEE